MRLEYLLQVLASCTRSTNKGCCLAATLCAMCRVLHCSGTRSTAALWLDRALLTCSDDIFCHLPDCVPAYRAGRDLSQQRQELLPPPGRDRAWIYPLTVKLNHSHSPFSPSHSRLQQCLSYPSTFLSLWSLTCSGLLKPVNSLDPKEQSVLFAKQADPATRGRFPGWLSDVTQAGCNTDKTFLEWVKEFFGPIQNKGGC